MVSLRPNYFVSIGYLKTGTERGFKAVQALNPPGSTIISIGHHGSRSFDFCALPLAHRLVALIEHQLGIQNESDSYPSYKSEIPPIPALKIRVSNISRAICIQIAIYLIFSGKEQNDLTVTPTRKCDNLHVALNSGRYDGFLFYVILFRFSQIEKNSKVAVLQLNLHAGCSPPGLQVEIIPIVYVIRHLLIQ